MNLKATSGWWLEGPLKLCAEKYKPQEKFLNNTPPIPLDKQV